MKQQTNEINQLEQGHNLSIEEVEIDSSENIDDKLNEAIKYILKIEENLIYYKQ